MRKQNKKGSRTPTSPRFYDMKKLIIILLCLISFSANSQNKKGNTQSHKIDPTVEVNRDFEGKMMEITKGKLNTGVNDSLYNFKVGFNYSFFEKPYKDMYEFAPVASAKVPQLENTNRPELIARVGMGYPLAPEAEILYSPELGNGNYLNLGGNFNLYKGDLPMLVVNTHTLEDWGKTVENKEYKYGIGAEYTKAWKSGEFNLRGGFGGGYSTYYGKTEFPTTSGDPTNTTNSTETVLKSAESPYHTYNQANAGMGIKSSGAGKYGKKFNYSADLSFKHTTDKKEESLKENLIGFHGEMGPTVGRYNKFMVGIDAQAVMYTGTTEYHYGIFGITPQYRFENGNLKVNAGVKLQGKFTNAQNEADKYHNVIFPAVDFSWGIAPQKFWLYAMATGWNNINAYSSLLERNNYINPDTAPQELMASSVPLNVEGGFKGRCTDKFSYNIYAGYSIHNGLLQFLHDMGEGWFDIIYTKNNEFYAGAQTDINTERFLGGISFKYSSFSQQVIGIPSLQSRVYAQYNWNKRVFITAECNLYGEYNCYEDVNYYVKVPGFADLDAGVEYVFTPAISFWVKGKNLLNENTQYLPYYMGRRRGFVAGIIVKL